MDGYRKKLLDIIAVVHQGCFEICKDSLGKYLPVAGNIGIFCQTEDDFQMFTRVREEITEPSINPNQKYFRLKEPIVLPTVNGIPETTYTYLYIRKPSPDSPELGDVDFVLPANEYVALKQRILSGEKIKGAQIYNRPGWDNIEIRDSQIKALTYVSTQEMAEKVRIKF